MNAKELGRRYDQIATWWNDEISRSNPGMDYVKKALDLINRNGKALDIGCGGGRFIELLKRKHEVTGIDVSGQMTVIAKARHPDVQMLNEEFLRWNAMEKFDVIIAWDSIFHAPYEVQEAVITKMCAMLRGGGVVLYTAGGVAGQVSGTMQGISFDYASLDFRKYVSILDQQHCAIILMERDQYPLEHMVFIGRKVGK